MPGYKGHLVGGAVAFAGLILLLKLSFKPSFFDALHFFGCALLGALFPDIDIKSRGQAIFYRFLVCLLLILLIKRERTLYICLSFVMLLPLLVRHRGLFHRMWFILILAGASVALCAYLDYTHMQYVLLCNLFFVTGAASHLLLDRVM